MYLGHKFNDKHKNGIIYIKTDDFTTDAEFAMKIMHEFRHVLQHYNFLEGGFTNDFKVSPELLADVKKHYPGLFTNKIIRDRFKTDEKIVQQFIYWQVSGEQNAFAFNPNILFGKPWFATHEAGKGVLYAPWYTKNADGSYSGIYQVEIASRMADTTDESAPESKAKGHKLTERGSALPYKGKGKRKVVSEEIVGEPIVKTDKRTGKPSTHTVLSYIGTLRESFLFYPIKRFDIKGRQYLRTLGKYYIVDLGIRNFLLGFRERDRGHAIENLVYFELLRRGYDVAVGKVGDLEIDFIANSLKEKIYFQVTENMINPEVRARELRPLQMIRDNYPKIVLSLDPGLDNDYDGIKSLNLIDWLLDDPADQTY